MQSSQRLTVGGTVLLGLLVAVLVAGAAPGVAAQADNATATQNATFGAQVSAFMQSTAADANGSVERGMWASEVANASNPGAVVSDRARQLERRINRLEARSQALSADSDGGPRDVVAVARASAVRAELANLRLSVDQTVATAESSGVDDADLSTLRERAGNVTPPDLPEEARRVTSSASGPPEWVPGPSENPGADQGNRPDDAGQAGPPDERGNGGPPAGEGDAPGNGGDAGPGDAGNGNPPDDAGNAGDADGASDDDPGNSGDAGNSNGGNGGGNAGSGGGAPSDRAGSGGNSGNSDNAGSGGQGNRP